MIDKKHCSGCHDDFYNGHNPMGVKECWHRANAKMVRRVCVHVDQPPPWTQKPIRVPDCYTMERFVFVDPKHPSCKRGKE